MPDRDGIFDVVFSDADHERAKNLSSRLRELGYETAHGVTRYLKSRNNQSFSSHTLLIKKEFVRS